MNEVKQKFVDYYMRNGRDAHKAALRLYPGDYLSAAKIANEWPIDKEVLTYIAEWINANGEPPLLTKEQMVQKIIDRLDKMDNDTFIKAAERLSKLLGYDVDPKTVIGLKQTEPFTIVLSKDDANI